MFRWVSLLAVTYYMLMLKYKQYIYIYISLQSDSAVPRQQSEIMAHVLASLMLVLGKRTNLKPWHLYRQSIESLPVASKQARHLLPSLPQKAKREKKMFEEELPEESVRCVFCFEWIIGKLLIHSALPFKDIPGAVLWFTTVFPGGLHFPIIHVWGCMMH